MPEQIVTGTEGGSNNGSNSGVNNGNPNPNANASGGDTSRVVGDQGGNNGGKFAYAEDRSKWINPESLKHRFDEVGKRAATEAEKRLAEKYAAEIESRDARIRALAGVETPSKEAAESAEIRNALEAAYPELKQLNRLSDGKFFEKLEKLMNAAESMESTANSIHERQAVTMIDNLIAQVGENIGSELSQRQKQRLAAAYKDEAEACMAARENDPSHDSSNDFLTRHSRGDETLITELATAWAEDWIEPARKSANVQNALRFRPTPRGGRGNPIVTKREKPDLTKPGAFEEAMAGARRDEGGRFGSGD